jgi:hypothetical protein
MIVDCKEFEKLLSEGMSELTDAAAEHLRGCRTCAEEWQAWQDVAQAAPALRKAWESPDLWPRIRQSLEAETEKAARGRRWRLGGVLQFSFQWQAAAAAIILVLAGLGGWMMFRPPREASVAGDQRLLTERTLDEIERNETAYLKSIDKLSQLAAPKVEHAESPILASYREKLLLIDSAIEELRNQVERNRFNAHLRRELLLIYQQKQHTLEEVLKDGSHAN